MLGHDVALDVGVLLVNLGLAVRAHQVGGGARRFDDRKNCVLVYNALTEYTTDDRTCVLHKVATMTTDEKMEAARKLAERWRKDAKQYQAQVDEARAKGTPHEQMISAVTFLRACAKELEDTLK